MAKEFKDELRDELVNVVNKLIQRGLLPQMDNKAKNDLVSQVADKLLDKKDISREDLKFRKEETWKALGLACIAQHNPTNKFDYTLLFKPQDGATEEKLTKELKSIFDNLLKPRLEMNKKTLTNDEKKLLDHKFEELASLILKKQFKADPNTKIYENSKLFDTVALLVDTESSFRRMMYGAGQPGEVEQPILGQPIGNQLGVTDLAPDISGGSFMSQVDNPYSADPLGFKIDELFKDLANSPIDTEVERLAAGLEYKSPTLKMH